ncbi:N-acetylglucosamine kinase [Devosia sp. Root635]|uniref:N-acetylglucosamine kinase n=1 Tax=Devosia sp. Root635 TaxID=1736575 RepID=UPI0009E9F7B6|nr:BadF/BadG/BcrA/BcrD ATPase family protein [Devosia sp. Root635]
MGLDIGGTASRFVLCGDDGRELTRGKAPGATGHVFNPAEKDRLRHTLAIIAAAIAADGYTIASITAGLTGYGAAVSDEVTALAGAVFGVAPDAIILIDDVALAYLANFAPGEGHLVSAGTGSIGIHIGADGDFVRVGGRGILIDDAGSGSWIALRALDRIYRVLDHDGSFDAVSGLAQNLQAQVGGADWHATRQFIYAGDRGRIGTLAVAVARAAEDGDAVAATILREAGAELARLAEALTARAGRRPIGFAGGVLSLHPSIGAEIRRQLDGHDVRLVSADAALAAARTQTLADDRWRRVLAGRASIA